MDEIYEYMKSEETSVKEEIYEILGEMCAGHDYRECSEDMVDKLYEQIEHIMVVDLHGQDEDVRRLAVTEEMVITAMMMCIASF